MTGFLDIVEHEIFLYASARITRCVRASKLVALPNLASDIITLL